ncbi:MAG TPA: response regulator [Ktedonobacterales bacterium]|nr:response regulator [Ktedonobacterales bacterium]
MDSDSRRVKRLLVVDDDPALLVTLAEGLRLSGHFEVFVANDGATGLQHFFEVFPDCVVVDVRMPGLNGYQFVRALRGDPTTAQTPLVILSALIQDHEQLAGLLSGADAYLTKPVKIVDLVRAIQRTVNLTVEERQRAFQDLSGLQEPEVDGSM